jgi:hypothetical protein
MSFLPKPTGPTLEDLGRKKVRRRPVRCEKGYRAVITEYDKGDPTVACNNPNAPLECFECPHGTYTDFLFPFEETEFWGEKEKARPVTKNKTLY